MGQRQNGRADGKILWQGNMSSLSYTFSPATAKPVTSPTATINRGADIPSRIRAGAEGLPFDVVSNASVGSVNRSEGAPARGGVSKWDGRRWLLDERDEEQLKKDAEERFRARMGRGTVEKSAGSSLSSAQVAEKNTGGHGGRVEGGKNVSTVPRTGFVPAQAMLTCFYSLHGGFLTEVIYFSFSLSPLHADSHRQHHLKLRNSLLGACVTEEIALIQSGVI